MKSHFIFSCLLFISFISFGQTKYQGYIYDLETQTRRYFTYSASTSFDNAAYRTTYNIFDVNGKVRYVITADHYKSDQKVVVEVNDVRYLLSSMNAKQQATYEQPSTKPFGFRGDVGLFDKSAPNQLAIQFLSSRFEYVRILNFLGSYEDGHFQYFIFKPTDKIVEQASGARKQQSASNLNGATVPKAVFSRPRSSAMTVTTGFMR